MTLAICKRINTRRSHSVCVEIGEKIFKSYLCSQYPVPVQLTSITAGFRQDYRLLAGHVASTTLIRIFINISKSTISKGRNTTGLYHRHVLSTIISG